MVCYKTRRRGKGGTPGFSLIELSAVISIAGAVAVGLLSWSQPEQKTLATKSRHTQGKMRELAAAIETFKVKYGRLPCPADPFMRADDSYPSADTAAIYGVYNNSFGNENLDTDDTDPDQTAGTDCPVNVGSVPVYALEMPEEYMFDGWGRRYTYHVSDKLCGADIGMAAGLSEEVSRKKGCTAYDYKSYSGDLQITGPDGTRIITGAAYVLLSHGPNGYGAFLPSGSRVPFPADAEPNEQQNADNYDFSEPPVFTKSDPANDAYITYVMSDVSENERFDDIILARTKAQTESLTTDENRVMMKLSRCQEIGDIIRETDFKQLYTLAEENTALNKKTEKASTNTNKGGAAILTVLDALQRLCIKYHEGEYSYQCPGTSVWNSTDERCECSAGVWELCF